MSVEEALAKMREYPGGSYMRCPFCGCKSSTHEPACAIEIVAAALKEHHSEIPAKNAWALYCEAYHALFQGEGNTVPVLSPAALQEMVDRLLPSAALPTQPPQESDTARSETVAGSSSPAVAAPFSDDKSSEGTPRTDAACQDEPRGPSVNAEFASQLEQQLRAVVEAVEKWDDAEEPDDLGMLEVVVRARRFLETGSTLHPGSVLTAIGADRHLSARGESDKRQLMFTYEAILTEMRAYGKVIPQVGDWVKRLDLARDEAKAHGFDVDLYVGNDVR